MGTKAGKRKAQAWARNQKRRRARQAKRKQQLSKGKLSPGAIGKKHRQQMERLVPAAWHGENPLDVAVFDTTMFAGLSGQEKLDVAAVKEAFDFLAHNRGAEAENAVSGIAFKSPLSDWRLLIRGMCFWLENDQQAATHSWSRLDAERRPARIAKVLKLAHRDDLASMKSDSESDSSVQPDSTRPKPALTDSFAAANSFNQPPVDVAMLQAAKVIRRTRIDRAAIKIATVAVNQKMELEDEIPGITLTPDLINWLAGFANDFRDSEPELVRALELAALDRASNQAYIDIYDAAAKKFSGPNHDPKNFLRSFFYFAAGNDEDEAECYLQQFRESLSTNSLLSESLRNAILSISFLHDARSHISRRQSSDMQFSFFRFDENEADVQRDIQELFKTSIKSHSANREAHLEYTNWIRGEMDDRDMTKQQQQKLGVELFKAMTSWLESLPNDAEPRLFLVEKLLDDDKLEEAQPHVQWLVKSRQNSPQIRALPWRVKLLEATKLCRRKSNLLKVPDVLRQVELQWPQWLSTRWLPYFHAAWSLRSGDQAGYDQERQLICEKSHVSRDSLADACMMLGAAQRMRVVATDLKPLRVPVETAVKNVKTLSLEELFGAGSFFWGMYKSGFFYPAFRMHGSKFGREILKRINAEPGLVGHNIENSAFLDTIFWISERRFWSDGYELKFPPPLQKLVGRNVYIRAAHVNAMVQLRWPPRQIDWLESAEYLRLSARSEPDTYLRFWLNELAQKAEDQDREMKERFSYGGLGRMFGNMFGNMFSDEEECNCPECRAERARRGP